MAFRPLLRQRTIAPILATSILASILLYPRRDVFADSPEDDAPPLAKKPIYDDAPPLSSSPPTRSDFALPPSSPSLHVSPKPTDRLASQIKRTRLFLHGHAASAESRLNALMSSFLSLESSFTSTLASLAPPRGSGEKLLPGAIYVLVAAMAGSIATRNRGIVLRALTPVAVGIGAGYVVLPITTRNVGDLVWRYEERYPAVRDNHLRIKEEVQRVWYTGKAHSQMTVARLDEAVAGLRESLENWVRKGR